MSFIASPRTALKTIMSSVTMFMLISCGGGDSTTSPPQDDTSSRVMTVTGQFIDDKVQGLSYSCTSARSGKTNSNGEYTCEIGDHVTFAIGPAVIGTSLAHSGAITPYTLFPDDGPAAVALARILQSIDADDERSNGLIVIDSEIARAFPDTLDLSDGDTSDLEAAVAGLELIDATDAKTHLDASIAAASNSGSVVAEAGAIQNVKTGDEVTLDGSGSEISGFDGDMTNGSLFYRWEFISRPQGSLAQLSDATSLSPSFIADLDGEYALRLTISRNDVLATDEVLVTADTNNSTPVADAGDDLSVPATSDDFSHTFDGSNSSDADVDDVLTYRWDIVSIPDALDLEQIDPTGDGPRFRFTSAHLPVGEYVIRLVVDDGKTESLPDDVTMTAINSQPRAELMLYKDEYADGRGSSDPNGDTLTYRWTLLSSPDITEPVLLDWTDDFHVLDFIDSDGFYLLELIVDDGRVESLPARLTIIHPDIILEGPVVNNANGHTYYLFKPGYSWLEAEAMAIKLGGHLVTINDQAEDEWVWSTFSGPDENRSIWIGLTDKEEEGTFTWTSGEGTVYTNGESIGYTNWNKGEPNNSGDEDYGEFDGQKGGGWNDRHVDGGVNIQRYGLIELPSS